jgi:hypothetical protein
MYYGQDEGLNGETTFSAEETLARAGDALGEAKQMLGEGVEFVGETYEQYVMGPEQANEMVPVPVPRPANRYVAALRREALDANRDDVITRGEVRTFTFGALFGILLGRFLFR